MRVTTEAARLLRPCFFHMFLYAMTNRSMTGSYSAFILPPVTRIPDLYHHAPPRATPSIFGSACATALYPVNKRRGVGARAATHTSTILLVADIQSLRDAFRAIFLPGLSIVTFSIPAVIIGLLLRALRGEKVEKDGNQQLLSVSSFPSSELNQRNAILAAKLLASIVIDLIGDGSFLIPGAGEGSDFLWAPVSALLIRLLYGSNVLSAVAFLEEILPFTDVVPTATLAFIFEVIFAEAAIREERDAGRQQQEEKRFNPVIDVRATTEEKDR